ncbi:hypothetical protein AGLY_006690 [Aphis glycines]|uniref:HTH CENPB-type domain-containing protein n=1 Tax=Aphis glycines TaxID=307491 RepID=A0A6G0TRT2_APHGL|nr:hypothetical protein AGLY_006690 [Aphis glycines]
MGQRDAAVRLNVSQSVLGRILKNREDIECEALQNEKKCGKDDAVERALKEWFVKVRNKDARVSVPLLRQKAEELAEKMGKVDFKATEGWFHRWKKRKKNCFQKMHGEQGDPDFTGAHFWLENEWPSLISKFSPSDVFNAVETGLKSKQPRCFKGALLVDYTADKDAWMTQDIFSQWLIKWDNELDRKSVLLVDNCTAHNVKNQHSVVNEAWNNISDATIRNCFRHGGFVKTEEEEEEEDDHSKDLADKTYEDWMNIDRDLQTFEEYSEDQICQSIINEITNNNDEEDDESDEEEVDVVVKPPSNKEVLEALDVIRRAVHHRDNNFNIQYEYEHM